LDKKRKIQVYYLTPSNRVYTNINDIPKSEEMDFIVCEGLDELIVHWLFSDRTLEHIKRFIFLVIALLILLIITKI